MKEFAAFIMTFKRNKALQETIEKLLKQTQAPEKVLIIDNDPEMEARQIPGLFPDYKISYHAMGSNTGPAGAAYAGLKILSEEGYDYIAWIDDDDPPFFEDTMEILLNLMKSDKQIGCVGSVGQYFHKSQALIKRVQDNELETEGSLLVDNIAGNMIKIVRAEAIRNKSILPDATLFFGFEELDFDLNLQKAGFSIVCDRQLYKRHRVFHNRQGLQIKYGRVKNKRGLAREYYSTRNMLCILKKNGLYVGLFSFLLRTLFKMLWGFRNGVGYGIQNFSIQVSAISDFMLGKTGMRNFLVEKDSVR